MDRSAEYRISAPLNRILWLHPVTAKPDTTVVSMVGCRIRINFASNSRDIEISVSTTISHLRATAASIFGISNADCLDLITCRGANDEVIVINTDSDLSSVLSHSSGQLEITVAMNQAPGQVSSARYHVIRIFWLDSWSGCDNVILSRVSCSRNSQEFPAAVILLHHRHVTPSIWASTLRQFSAKPNACHITC